MSYKYVCTCQKFYAQCEQRTRALLITSRLLSSSHTDLFSFFQVCAGNNRERLNSDDDRAKKQLKAEANCKKLISAKRHSSTAARDLQARPVSDAIVFCCNII